MTKRVRARAILLLRCVADLGLNPGGKFDNLWRYAMARVGVTYREDAHHVSWCARRAVTHALDRMDAIPSAIGRAEEAKICLEAAALLEDGWDPEDEVGPIDRTRAATPPKMTYARAIDSWPPWGLP